MSESSMTSLTIPRSSGTIEMAKAPRAKRVDEWSDEMNDSLRAHWAGGGSASKIANAMSEKFGVFLTRCAILGKRNRLGLPKRDAGRLRSAERKPYVRKSRAQGARPVANRGAPVPKPVQPVKQAWVKMPYPEPLRVHFIDRTRLQCSRPLWADKWKPPIAQMFVCGNPVEDGAHFEFCPACASNLLVPAREKTAKPLILGRLAA